MRNSLARLLYVRIYTIGVLRAESYLRSLEFGSSILDIATLKTYLKSLDLRTVWHTRKDILNAHALSKVDGGAIFRHKTKC
jgi:hypothetical protein